MRVVEMIADEIVRVAGVRHRRMAAAGAVDVAWLVSSTGVPGGADVRVAGGDLERALVEVIPMHGVEAAVVEVVDVIAVANGSMAAAFAVDVGVPWVDAVVGHGQTFVISKTEAKG